MVLASKPEAVNELSGGTKAAAPSEWDVKQKEVLWSQQDQHKKLLEKKARPDDAWPGIPGKQIPLRDDQTFIPGLLNGHGSKVRL